MFTNTTPTPAVLENFDPLNLQTFSNNSDRQCESSGMSISASCKQELVKLQSGPEQSGPEQMFQKKMFSTKHTHKKKRPTSLKNCVNPHCTHQMGCKAKMCKICKTNQPYKFTKCTKPKSINKGYGNGKLECAFCHSLWGTRKLRCDCGAENTWDKKRTLKNTKKRPHSNLSARETRVVATKAPKRKRCDSFEEFLLEQQKEENLSLEPARPRGDSMTLIEPTRPNSLEANSASVGVFEEDFGYFWPIQDNKRPRLDSFELMSTEEINALI